jgi:hypothetical protein
MCSSAGVIQWGKHQDAQWERTCVGALDLLHHQRCDGTLIALLRRKAPRGEQVLRLQLSQGSHRVHNCEHAIQRRVLAQHRAVTALQMKESRELQVRREGGSFPAAPEL